LNELKDCEYHRLKIKQFMGDFNKVVEENLKIKEKNSKLEAAKKNLTEKLEIALNKIKIFMGSKNVMEAVKQLSDNKDEPEPLVNMALSGLALLRDFKRVNDLKKNIEARKHARMMQRDPASNNGPSSRLSQASPSPPPIETVKHRALDTKAGFWNAMKS